MEYIFQDNSLVFIDKTGQIIKVPRKESEQLHYETYMRLKEEDSSIMKGVLTDDLKPGDTYQLVNRTAVQNNIVICPLDIRNPQLGTFITLPKLSNVNSLMKQSLEKIVPNLKSSEMMFLSTAYYDEEETDIIGLPIYEDGDTEEAINTLIELIHNTNQEQLKVRTLA